MKPEFDTSKTGYKRALYKMWHLAYLDKGAFGQANVQLSQQDLLRICEQSLGAPEQGVYVVPAEPSEPLSPSNALVVNKLQRKFLLALWKLDNDEDAYRKCASAFAEDSKLKT